MSASSSIATPDVERLPQPSRQRSPRQRGQGQGSHQEAREVNETGFAEPIRWNPELVGGDRVVLRLPSQWMRDAVARDLVS